VAVTDVLPGETPRTTPLALTLATWGLALIQATARPVKSPPSAARGSAVSWVSAPTETLT
jgi:hypothetical protein